MRQTSTKTRPALSALLIGLGATLACASPLGVASTGVVQGHLSFRGAPAAPEPVVVYLERLDSRRTAEAPRAAATLRPKDARTLLAVAPGQAVRFPASDGLHHRLFSYSEPNAFEVEVDGTAEGGEVVLRHPGVVRVYCSLHPWEHGVIFVAPTPYFDTVHPPADYEIRGVPPGRYELRSWGEATPSVAEIVRIRAGGSASIELAIDGEAAPQ